MTAANREVFLPLILRHIFKKSIQAFIHPRPAAFIRVYCHREINMADFVNNNTDKAIFDTA